MNSISFSSFNFAMFEAKFLENLMFIRYLILFSVFHLSLNFRRKIRSTLKRFIENSIFSEFRLKIALPK